MKAETPLKHLKNQTAGDMLFDIFNYLVLILLTLSILHLVLHRHRFIQRRCDRQRKSAFQAGGFQHLGISADFENTKIWIAYGNTIFYGVDPHQCFFDDDCLPMSRGNFFARNAILFFVMFTMYFKGGMIPTFLWMHQLVVYNTRFVMLLLPAINVFN